MGSTIPDEIQRAIEVIRINASNLRSYAENFASIPIDIAMASQESGEQALEQYSRPPLDNFLEFPEEFIGDPIARKWVCPITQRPIRKIIAVRVPAGLAVKSFYEQKALQQFWESSPAQMPPGWPEGVSPTKDSLKETSLSQSMIDANLLSLLLTKLADELAKGVA